MQQETISQPETTLVLIPEVVPKIEPEIAVQFLIRQGIEWAVSQMDPALKMMCKPILGICSSRIESITREDATALIQKLHEASYELEDKTGVINEFYT